ncbi:MAG: long-chain fatty acid--CoA ligase [Ignavibacterium sp.]|nr:MAG: long-chain fatty acid--CoA ligase [Ignavibacterium sp.]
MKSGELNFNRLIDILLYQQNRYPKEDTLCDKVGGEWRKFSIYKCNEIADTFSLGLLKMGIKKDDKIAIISGNRVEWNLVDIAALQVGAVIVPLYPNMSEENYKYIFKDSKVKMVFVGDEELFQKVSRVKDAISQKIDVYTFDKVPEAQHWSKISGLADHSFMLELKNIENSIEENDVATIIYTSGTTGVPKGVMLSHKNVVSNVKSLSEFMPMGPEHRSISFLPLCHIFERMATYFYLANGTSIYYAESTEKVADGLQEVKPHYFTTVPRLLEKVYDKIMAKGRELPPAKKAIFNWAMNVANHFNPRGKNNPFYNANLAVARKLVFSKWHEALGGNVKGIISGAAALQPRLAKLFTAAGIPIVEGYGLTETSPVLTCNRFNNGGFYLGTVGAAIPGVEIMIDDNGEILAKGPNVMLGYYKKPTETREAIDRHGWFHTGDIGELIDGKYLKIKDRLKEVFKTSGGKYVAPQPIENKMKESQYIEQIMVIGENRRFAAALIIPDFAFVEKWARERDLNLTSREEVVNNEDVKNKIWKEVNKYNKNIGKVQQVKKIALISDEWSVETEELTPTLKLKRRIIREKYKDVFEMIYNSTNGQHFV